MTLLEIAQEYRENQKPIEQRLAELRSKLSKASSCGSRQQIQHRINVLEKMLADSKRDVFEMEHYYEG